MIEIRRKDGNIRFRTFIDDSSELQQELLGRDICNVSFELPTYVAPDFGDYINVFGNRYTLNTPPKIDKKGDRYFTYDFTFEGVLYDLAKVAFNTYDRNNQLNKLDFPFKGKPNEFMQLLVANLNRVYQEQWTLGKVLEADEQSINFSSANCLSALDQIAQAFDTEYFVDGKSINLYKRQPSSGITIRFGEIAKSIAISSQNSANYITRLYVQGGNKNIEANYRGGALRLQLGNVPYLDINTNLPTVEGSVIFDDIYPHRTGVVSRVNGLSFDDDTIDFDVNDYRYNNPVIITFTSGALSGNDFAMSLFNGKTFTIQKNGKLPDEQFFPISVGDKYVITGIRMPRRYYDVAEAELQQRGEAYLRDKIANIPLQYEIECDELYLKRNFREFKIGEMVGIDIPDMGINTAKRVISIKRGITQPYRYAITLADTIQENILLKLLQ